MRRTSIPKGQLRFAISLSRFERCARSGGVSALEKTNVIGNPTHTS